MAVVWESWRPLVLGLAAAAFWAGAAYAQTASLEERLEVCAACHGQDGNSRMPNIPSLAGQPEFFTLNQLVLMREGVRRVEAMMPFVKDLKDAEITALARHYARLEAKPSDEPIDPARVRRGAELVGPMRCASCHQDDFSGYQQMPRLAKQRIDYLIHSLKEFRDNTRTGADTLMSNVVAGVPDADLAALAHYSASR